MIITPLTPDLIPQVMQLMRLGTPYVRPRTYSDYWLYASLFSSSCPVGLIDHALAGAVIAFRSQDVPEDVYIQDVVTHPEHRRKGIASALVGAVRERATGWGCARLYLTSEPENHAAATAWKSLGFVNLPGNRTVHGVSVVADYKGPGKDRAVFQLDLR